MAGGTRWIGVAWSRSRGGKRVGGRGGSRRRSADPGLEVLSSASWARSTSESESLLRSARPSRSSTAPTAAPATSRSSRPEPWESPCDSPQPSALTWAWPSSSPRIPPARPPRAFVSMTQDPPCSSARWATRGSRSPWGKRRSPSARRSKGATSIRFRLFVGCWDSRSGGEGRSRLAGLPHAAGSGTRVESTACARCELN